MRILFVVEKLMPSEPLGVMQLSAICKQHNHETRLITLMGTSLGRALKQFDPDVIAYSTMTPSSHIFKKADRVVGDHIRQSPKRVHRIMGGPHPTYFPDILDECGLDAICIGEGDHAILGILNSLSRNEPLLGIPNVLSKKHDPDTPLTRELIADLDSLPFADRDLLYDCAPYYKSGGLRSVLTSRGCPFNCSYCYNSAHTKMFQECGKVLRRRSSGHIIDELKHLKRNYPPVRMIRFADDIFVSRIDPWLVEFADAYRREVDLPFYCLMRPDTVTEDMARLLSGMGCITISMSIETGDESTRKQILNREISNDEIRQSFENARKHNINTHSNSMLGIPGTTVEQDFETFLLAKRLQISVAAFGIFCPYPKTELTEAARKTGLLPEHPQFDGEFQSRSVLNGYTEQEKDSMLRLMWLGPLFCLLPDGFIPVLKRLMRINLDPIYSFIWSSFLITVYGSRIFPHACPRSPMSVARFIIDSFRYSIKTKVIR